ncbi:MAG TPA: response regulator [Desulfuromonadaceae bacterium]|jgi:DNA-binding response OmpR family regulator
MDNRVMIVDDNEFIRESVEILFQTEGIRIVTAEGGNKCLDHLEAGFRGVLIMDVMMPQLDGWDTIRQIVARGLYDGNIILMLTAKREPDDNMAGIQQYVTDYVTKPFNPFELLDMVKYYATLLNDSEHYHDSP